MASSANPTSEVSGGPGNEPDPPKCTVGTSGSCSVGRLPLESQVTTTICEQVFEAQAITRLDPEAGLEKLTSDDPCLSVVATVRDIGEGPSSTNTIV
ncbi:MAG TPA: hypothetical protein VNA87_07625, partial [Actinomycetota bacterium]|nr:hypothetical protein [Actinomycetota bacterium]